MVCWWLVGGWLVSQLLPFWPGASRPRAGHNLSQLAAACHNLSRATG